MVRSAARPRRRHDGDGGQRRARPQGRRPGSRWVAGAGTRGVAHDVLLRSRFDVLPDVVAEGAGSSATSSGRRPLRPGRSTSRCWPSRWVWRSRLPVLPATPDLGEHADDRGAGFFLALAPTCAAPARTSCAGCCASPAGGLLRRRRPSRPRVRPRDRPRRPRDAATVVLFGVGMTVLALLAYPLVGSRSCSWPYSSPPSRSSWRSRRREFFALSTLPLLVWASAGLLVAVAGAALVAVWWFALRPDDVEPGARERLARSTGDPQGRSRRCAISGASASNSGSPTRYCATRLSWLCSLRAR